MIELDGSIPAELVPLSWLVGVWEGTGLISYAVGDETHEHEFRQRVSFRHDDRPYLDYRSDSWLVDDEQLPLTSELGFWRLSRPAVPGDAGPGMLPGVGARPYSTADTVETLRNAGDGFDVEACLVHPTGVSELYLGTIAGPRVQLATDAVMRSASAKEHAASTRMYGLVEGHLLWAWDISALGQGLRTHASGRLARVE